MKIGPHPVKLYPGLLLLTILLFSACATESDELSESEVLYYSCSGDIVIRAEKNTKENCQISIYDGKELVTGRQLVRTDSADWNYIGGDIAAALTDTTIVVDIRGTLYDDCLIAPEERSRREYRDTIYYITNTGALIKVHHHDGDDSIDLHVAYAVNEIFDGTLPRVRSGSGEKYEDGNTMFWSKDNTAMFIHQGINYSHCIRMWPDEIKQSPCDDRSLDNFVRAFLSRELAQDMPLISENERRYYAEKYDLNDDGKAEIIIALRSSYFCGSGGCTWYIAAPDTTALARITVSQFPVYVSTSKTNGYKDLHVASRDKYHTLAFSEDGYPGNPSMEPEIRLFSDPAYTTAGTERLLSRAYIKSCPF